MKEKLPISFYFKLMFIIITLMYAYITHRPLIDATLMNENLSAMESVNVILQGVLGMEGSSSQDKPLVSPLDLVSKPGNTEPQLISEEIKSLANYQIAAERANQFNQQFDGEALNYLLNERINTYRSDINASTMGVGHHLQEGTWNRTEELSLYHYLGSSTIEGTAFYSLFPEIPEPQYRLGENLYELYIAADDIHLETWSNPDILADYVYSIFQDSLESDHYQTYQSAYAWVQAEASDYNVSETAYVRLVVVLILDTNLN